MIGAPSSVEVDPVDARPTAPQKIITVSLCVVLNLVDGFDVLALTFTAPILAREWSLAPTELGLLFSAGLAGMAIGALVLSPLADRFGRRTALMLALILTSIGMVASFAAPCWRMLLLARILTGVGIGPLISSATAVVYEYSSSRWRGVSMGLMAVSFPTGAILGGIAALLLVEAGGWRAVFAVGAVATISMIPAIAILFPRSHDRRPRAPHLNNSTCSAKGSWRYAIDPVVTVRLSAIFCLAMASFYFVQTWLPKLIVQLGQPFMVGTIAGIALNVSGIAGGLLGGLAIMWVGARQTAIASLIAMAAAVSLISETAVSESGAIAIATLLGMTMFSTMAAIYTLLSQSYAKEIRATAIGIVSTAGRAGAAIGPAAAGLLLSGGCSASALTVLLALPCVAAVLLLFIRAGIAQHVRT